MPDGIGVSAEKGPEWDAVVAALNEVSATLPEEIKGRVVAVVDPWIAEAEAAVIAMPIKGVGKQTGLRGAVAAHVDKTTDGVPEDFEVAVSANNPGTPSEVIIPLGLDRPTGWRHPVFGKKKTWVQQIPLTHDWFTDAFGLHRSDEVANEIQDALDGAANRIDDAGA